MSLANEKMARRVGDAHLPRLIERQPQERGEVGTQDNLVRNDKDMLACVPRDELVEDGDHALIHIPETLPSRIRESAGVSQKLPEIFGFALADVLPGAAFPTADVTLHERVNRLRLQGVRAGEKGRRLHGAAERATVAVVEKDSGQVIAGCFGLPDTRGGQRRVTAPTEQARRMAQIGFGGGVTDQVEVRGCHGLA
jgi:hypothetical protein